MAEEEVKVESKNGKGVFIAIIGIILLLVIVIVVGVFFFLGEKKPQEETPDNTPTHNTAASGLKSNYAKPGPIFVITEPFIVNLVGQNGKRYAKATIAFELSSTEFQKEIGTKIPIIKDRINHILSSKSFEEVSTPKGKDKLKDQILEELNTFMVDGYIKSVFFTEFVIQ